MKLCTTCRFFSAAAPGHPISRCVHPRNLRRSPVDGDWDALEHPIMARSEIGFCRPDASEHRLPERAPMPGCTEERISGPSNTTHTLEGPALLVEQRVCELLAKYHPDGYGTCVTLRSRLPEGALRVVVTRASSCD